MTVFNIYLMLNIKDLFQCSFSYTMFCVETQELTTVMEK